MQIISPFLWFDDQAEEAMQYYTSIYNNSQILQLVRYTEQDGDTPVNKKVNPFFPNN